MEQRKNIQHIITALLSRFLPKAKSDPSPTLLHEGTSRKEQHLRTWVDLNYGTIYFWYIARYREQLLTCFGKNYDKHFDDCLNEAIIEVLKRKNEELTMNTLKVEIDYIMKSKLI